MNGVQTLDQDKNLLRPWINGNTSKLYNSTVKLQ